MGRLVKDINGVLCVHRILIDSVLTLWLGLGTGRPCEAHHLSFSTFSLITRPWPGRLNPEWATHGSAKLYSGATLLMLCSLCSMGLLGVKLWRHQQSLVCAK